MRVRMEHPKLPGQPIYVRPAAMRAYRWSGWREAPEPEPDPESMKQTRPQRRRRTTVEEDGSNAHAAA